MGILKDGKSEDAGISKEDFKSVMEALIEKIGKPSEVEQKKLDEEQEKLVRTRNMMMEQAQMDINAKRLRQGMCNHKKDDGRDDKYSIGGQINSDGCLHALCTRCQIELATIKAPPELYGVSFDSDLIAQILLPTGALQPKPLEEIRRLQVEINSQGKVVKSEEGEIAMELSS